MGTAFAVADLVCFEVDEGLTVLLFGLLDRGEDKFEAAEEEEEEEEDEEGELMILPSGNCGSGDAS